MSETFPPFREPETSYTLLVLRENPDAEADGYEGPIAHIMQKVEGGEKRIGVVTREQMRLWLAKLDEFAAEAE